IMSPLLDVLGKRFRFHQSACPHFLDPFGDDRFAAIEPLRDNPVVVDTVADFHRTNTDLVFGVDDRDLISALKLQNGALRHQKSIVLDANHGSNFPVATRTQNVAGVRKHARDTNRSGSFVHLTVSKVEPALVRVGCAVGENQLELQGPVRSEPAGLCREASAPVQVLWLSNGEVNLDRVYRRNRRDRSAAGTNKSPDLKLSLSGDPVDRRDKARKAEIDLRVLDRRLIRLNLSLGRLHRRLSREVILNRVVQVLLTRSLFASQRSVAVNIELSAPLYGFCVCQRRFRLS